MLALAEPSKPEVMADPGEGLDGSLGDLVRDPRLNHEVEVVGGVLAEECGALLRGFFAERR